MVDQELKTIKNFATASNILILVSIFIAGIPLGIAAIICACVARKKMNEYLKTHQMDDNIKFIYQRKIQTVFILSIIIFVINCVTAYVMYPYTAQMVNELMGQTGTAATGAGSGAASATGSIWG